MGYGINKVGLFLEGTYNKPLNPLFSWSVGLRGIQKGALKPPDRENGDNTLYRLTLNYISLPLYINYKKKGITYFIGLGGAYLINYKEENENGPMKSQTKPKKYEIFSDLGVRFQLSTKSSVVVQLENSLLPVRPFVGGAFRLNRGHYNTSLLLGFSRKI